MPAPLSDKWPIFISNNIGLQHIFVIADGTLAGLPRVMQKLNYHEPLDCFIAGVVAVSKILYAVSGSLMIKVNVSDLVDDIDRAVH
eukprot:scaffold507914_cov17-Prasinocladus_malaysianus.AAC.1